MRIDTIDLTEPIVEKAFLMALELQTYCEEHHFPETFVINGVAWNAEAFAQNKMTCDEKSDLFA